MRPACGGFPLSIVAPGVRREGPSLAHRGSRGIPAAQPPPQRFRSAS
ncbi:nucleoid-structuring protein H-NS [Pseudomonas cavernicola]|uniref:Nucleoid-structuring protein H-NS n=1 Tax=Pseudomonas cavernicola TaxID=2320866 RepID=A0A418XPA7_9PSED|nr:nucleoid-structuring protein H-NS [Pseudomonas cavernicola]